MYDPKSKLYVPNFNSLDRLVEERYLRKVISTCGKLMSYGYTDHCTYNRKWNKHTLNARGTVYEIKTGKVIARAFPKFFNFEELPESRARQLAKQNQFEVFEKVDGSLGIIYNYEGSWRVNTRGSFNSDQAVEAIKILEKYDLSTVPHYFSIMAEIIYPENRIIVDYGDERILILLGVFNACTGEEMGWDGLKIVSNNTGMPLPKRHVFNSIGELIEAQKLLSNDDEGFVVKFTKSGERVKFKSREYLKLAKLMAYMTPLNYWEHMKNGVVDVEMIESLPEELRGESDKIVEAVERSYRDMHDEVHAECAEIIDKTKDEEDQYRAIGLLLKQNNNYKHIHCAFSILNNKPEKVEQYIMRRIRPKGNEIKDL